MTDVKEYALSCLDAHSMVSRREAEIMADDLLSLPEEGRMLEIGTGAARSSAFFARLKPKWTIYTVDGYGLWGEDRNLYHIKGKENQFDPQGLLTVLAHWESTGVTNTVQIIADSLTLKWDMPLNAVFIDGDHSYRYVKSDFERYSPFVIQGGVVMFHDYTNVYDVKSFLDAEVASNPEWKMKTCETIAKLVKLS